MIPYGVIDWSTKYDELSFDYIILATLGNVIAHQIAHHFDANGIFQRYVIFILIYIFIFIEKENLILQICNNIS